MKKLIKIHEVMMAGRRGASWTYRSLELIDFFPIKLTWKLFTLGASDYDVGDDEMCCPCGETMERPETLGAMVRVAKDHLRKEHGR